MRGPWLFAGIVGAWLGWSWPSGRNLFVIILLSSRDSQVLNCTVWVAAVRIMCQSLAAEDKLTSISQP